MLRLFGREFHVDEPGGDSVKEGSPTSRAMSFLLRTPGPLPLDTVSEKRYLVAAIGGVPA